MLGAEEPGRDMSGLERSQFDSSERGFAASQIQRLRILDCDWRTHAPAALPGRIVARAAARPPAAHFATAPQTPAAGAMPQAATHTQPSVPPRCSARSRLPAFGLFYHRRSSSPPDSQARTTARWGCGRVAPGASPLARGLKVLPPGGRRLG